MSDTDSPKPAPKWLELWEKNDTGWHLDAVHPALEKYVGDWKRVLVPLCGATLDLRWLAERNIEVHGSELSPIATQRAFSNWAQPTKTAVTTNDGSTYVDHRANGLTVHCGDFFALAPTETGVFDTVWDRGAMVALPETLRPRYVEHLSTLAPGGDMLLSVFHYDPTAMQGPPFSIDEGFLHEHLDNVQQLDETTASALLPPGVVERTYRAQLRGNKG